MNEIYLNDKCLFKYEKYKNDNIKNIENFVFLKRY